MSPALILGLIGGLLVPAFLANRLSRLTRIPDAKHPEAWGLSGVRQWWYTQFGKGS
jgi:hypothetical protein